MKRILYFYPHKFAQLTDGIHARIVTILEYFKSRGYVVDMVNFEHPEIHGSYIVDRGLVENLYLVEGNPFVASTRAENGTPSPSLSTRIDNLSLKIARKLSRGRLKQPTLLPDFMNAALRDKVTSLFREKEYTALFITYTYWSELATLAANAPRPVRSIIDPTDFLALQNFYSGNTDLASVGAMFGDEIRRMSLFDDIVHISYDELLLFSNFITGSKHYYIPQYFESNEQDENRPLDNDILFIASGNPYNVEGIHWFFDQVYPFVDPSVKMLMAGNICNKTDFKAPNVTKLGFVNDVKDLYQKSKLTICPVKRGSGMKIKVIESLSYGLPVVSTLKGLDGFANKEPAGGITVTDSPQAFADAINKMSRSPELYKEQSRQAKALFANNFSYERNFSRLDEIFGS